MAKTYIVAPGQEFNYPDSHSREIVEMAGGRSKLTEDQKKLVTYKTVKEGEDCSDMPPSALELYLSRGWVIDPDAIKVEDAVAEELQAEATVEEEGI